MARTISDIKTEITGRFMADEIVQRTYGFEPGTQFETVFSSVSLESIVFYVVASAIWAQEGLFDMHRQEVETRIEEILPHRPKWYRDKMLAFMKNKELVTDTDRYDTSGMSQAQIAAVRVVKYAVANESADASIVTIKVAGEQDGVRCQLDSDTETQLTAYLAEIKDAGVRISLINLPPDTFNCEVDIYYNAMLLCENVESACRPAIRDYVENLPFNGEYTNMALVDVLQKIEGVRIVEFKGASTSISGESVVTQIDARYTPTAGYFKIGTILLNMKVYG